MQKDISVDSKRIIYTPSNFAKSSLLYLQETGTLTALKPHTNTRNDLNSYLFFVVLSGCGSLKYCDEVYSLRQGDCVFIDCNKPYSHSTAEKLWVLQWAHFNGAVMEGIYQKYLERGGRPVFHPADTVRYANTMDSLYGHAASEDYLRDMRINETLSSLLTQIMEMSWQGGAKKGDEISSTAATMENVKQYLDDNITKKITLEEISDKFFVNKFYLTRVFKEQYATTIFNYITSKRISMAKRMLRFSDSSVEEIAEKCGFEDANYFSRTFKKIEEMSPSEYRKMWGV